ncbi:TPA: hypothetical protein ACGOWZ_001211 [Streptococcus suis]
MKKTVVSLATVAFLGSLVVPVTALEPGTTIDPNNHSKIEAPTAEPLPTLNIEAFLEDGTIEITQVPSEAPTAPAQTSDLIYSVKTDEETGEQYIVAVPATAPTKESLNLKGGIDENGDGYVYGITTDVEVPTPVEEPTVPTPPSSPVVKTLPSTSPVQ